MLEPTSSLQAATDASAVHRIHPGAGAALPWRALAAAALLSLAFGLALFQVLTAQRPSLTAAARHRSSPPQHGLSSLPLSAQGPISGALGADDPAYRIRSSSGVFQAASPAQRLQESFGPAGVLVSSGTTRLGLSLRAIGYGTSLATLRGASPRAEANRVSYAYPGLSEWYRNGPLGLEQGFTITRAPSGDATAPLTLSLALSGDAHVSLGSGAHSLTLSGAGGPSLRYGGLRVSDAAGRTLHSWLGLRAGRVLLRANTRGARYPLRIDPFIQQGEKLTGTGQSGPVIPRVGFSVALSSDGNTALIGGPEDYGKTGSAWVFTRSLGVWTQQGSKFTGTGAGIEARFGASVALSSDGNTALIGGPDAKGDGQAWVFTRLESKWSQQGPKLTGSGAVGGAEFGWSVALSSDGNTALIGGPGDSKGIGVGLEERTGAAWVFTRSLGVWTQQGSKLIGNGEVSEKRPSAEVEAKFPGEFGASVALSSDGNTALIGGPGDNKGVGAAWAFTRSGSTWTQPISKLTGSGEVSSEAIPGEFGESVALAAEGNTALIGGPGDNKGLGAAWAFTRPSFGSAYTQQGSKLTGTGEVSEEPGLNKFPGRFGASVALASTEGNTALIGGPGDNKGVGAAWAFTRSGSTWTQQGSKLTGSGEVSSEKFPGDFGASVALSSDGNTALMGGPGDNGELGAAWAFTRSGSTWTQQGSKLTGTGASARSMGLQGASVALSSDGNTALVGGPGDGLGAVWVFTRSGSTWTQQGSKLTGGEEIGEARVRFGDAVALSADGNTALIGGLGDNKEAGAAWVFTRSGSTWTQQGSKLTGTGETGEGAFGSSVALSSDGNTALISGPADNGFIGAAWVFTRSGSTWTQQGSKLTGSGGSGFIIEFGSSVALSSDGNTALIGAQVDNVAVGAAWVFTRSESTWTQQGSKLTGSGEAGSLGAQFGRSVALSSDGNTALIGGPADNSEVGAAWVFTRSGSTWTQQGSKLTGTGESGEGNFGASVALSSDGSTALIGGPLDNKKEIGAAWAFTRSASTWTQLESKLTGTGGTTGMINFGSSVALSSEGNTALIGGPQDYNRTGAAWVFYQNLPTVVTGAASSVVQSSATLNGTVNPDGSEVSACKFEYGTTTSYGSSVPCATSPGAGTSPVAVSAAVTGLTTNTIYHFRVSATNAVGTTTGLDQTFKTLPPLPTVVTEAASGVAQTSATLHGSVNPNGFEVSACRFEYGTTTAYGSSAPCVPPPGSGSSAVPVSAALESLGENTTYHFRVVATGPGGTSLGADQTFTTLLVLGPHWYKNGVILEEGAAGTDFLAWGALTLENSKIGALTCQTLDGGDIANLVGGGAGKGAIDAFTFYDCVSPMCEGVGGKAEVIPERLEWSSLLIEEAGVFRDKLEGVALRVICAAKAFNVEFHGTVKPKLKNGTLIGSSPSKLEFDTSSGSLESIEGAGAITGKLKMMGFEVGEIVKANNP